MYAHPETQNVTLFGNRAFVDVICVKLEISSCWIRMGPKSNENILRQNRTYRDTRERRYENGGRDWSVYKPREAINC